MLVLYYNGSEYINFIKCNVSINIMIAKNLPLDLSKITLRYDGYVKPQFIDIIPKTGVGIYHISDKFQINFVSNILTHKPYNQIPKSKNKTIIHKLLLDYMDVKNEYDKYMHSKIFMKFAEIISFLLFKKLFFDLDKDDYIILIFRDKKQSINDKVLDKIIKAIKSIMYKNIYVSFLLLYIYGLFIGGKLFDTYGLYKVINEDLIFMSSLSIYKDNSKNKFTTIFSNDEIELYIGKSKKTEIEMLEVVKVMSGDEEVVLKPIRHSRIDSNNTSLIGMKHITRVLSKSFELTSVKKFIEEAVNLIDKKTNHIQEKKDVINLLFSSLLGLSLTYSNKITKVYSFSLDIHYFIFSPLEVVFFDKVNDRRVYLLDFDLIALPQKLKENNSIRNSLVYIDVYSADLSFISENSFFIFPIIRVYYRDIEIPYITENQKRFEFNVLDKKMVSEIYLEEVPIQIYMEDIRRKLKIKILYSLLD